MRESCCRRRTLETGVLDQSRYSALNGLVFLYIRSM